MGGFLCLFLTNWIAVRIPGELGRGVDALEAGDGPAVVHSAGVIALLGLAVIVVRTLSRVLVFTPGRYVEWDLRNDIFRHLMRLQPRNFHALATGDVISRSSNDITMARALVGFGTMQVVNIAAALSLTGREMVRIDPWLTLWVVLPVVVATALTQGAIRALFHLTRAAQQHLARISDHVLASLQGMTTVQAFRAEPAFRDRFESHNRRFLHTGLRLASIGAVMQPALAASSALAVYLLLVLGGRMTAEGELTVGQFAAFTTYLLYLVPPLRSFGWLIAVVQRGRASLDRIFELLDIVPDRPELGPEGDREPLPLPTGRPLGFSVRGLTFAYPDAEDEPVLHDLTFEIPPGRRVGLFGPTGSGKTTLLEILARLRNAPPGRVFLVDGAGAEVDLTRVDLDTWRDQLSVVPQVPFLFSDSLAENVSLEHEPDPAAVRAAIRDAALEDDVQNLPQGPHTLVGERGVMLSGGQRQRVALARGFFRDFQVLMLDDVLSAVDHDTEQRLIAAIERRGGRGGAQRPTTVLVSHRTSALVSADHILVLHRGRLVDQGTHEQLVARPGLYRDAWKAQTAREARADDPASGEDPAPEGPEGGAP